MAGLRTLLQLAADSSGSVNFDEFHIYNTNKTGHNNGGCCCLWTVPTGVAWFAVEMWGGGGGGAGACCCMQGWPGGSGSYARKFVTGLSGTGGETYTICAAGSTYCSQAKCVGCIGNPSFLSINGGAVQVCASGGGSGYVRCYFSQVVWDFAELQARLKVVHSVHQVHGVQCHQHHLQMAETEIQECIVSMVAVYMQAISLIGQVAEEQVQYRIVRQQDVVRQAQVA
jgi:hypothetical protein